MYRKTKISLLNFHLLSYLVVSSRYSKGKLLNVDICIYAVESILWLNVEGENVSNADCGGWIRSQSGAARCAFEIPPQEPFQKARVYPFCSGFAANTQDTGHSGASAFRKAGARAWQLATSQGHLAISADLKSLCFSFYFIAVQWRATSRSHVSTLCRSALFEVESKLFYGLVKTVLLPQLFAETCWQVIITLRLFPNDDDGMAYFVSSFETKVNSPIHFYKINVFSFIRCQNQNKK